MFSSGSVAGRHMHPSLKSPTSDFSINLQVVKRGGKKSRLLGPVRGAEATRSLPCDKTEKTSFAAWCRVVCHTMSSDSVLSGFYAVSYMLSICSWSHISFYEETSPVSIPSQILTPVVTMAKSFSSPCLQACIMQTTVSHWRTGPSHRKCAQLSTWEDD